MSQTIATLGRLDLPGRYSFNRRNFYRVIDAGVFEPDDHLELIEGQIIVKERPMKSAHATGLSRSDAKMRQIFSVEYHVRNQLPITLNNKNEPLPDIAIVVGSIDDYEAQHPKTAVLIIEISDYTLRHDRNAKGAIYARAEIADYWILNLKERVLEVRRNPVAMRGKLLGHGYADLQTLTETESIAPLASPDSLTTVADLLPRLQEEKIV